MAQHKKQWMAIVMMMALFAMIAFVTNLCSPMASILKDQFGASNALAQIGNYGNFIAYLLMGIPSGMLIKKYGYKKTALAALVVGIVGVFVQWMSGWDAIGSFGVYLLGAFVSGLCMCMLNTVVNPMLNLLGGGGNKGNQLVQIGGVFNSAAAVAVYIIMGALLADVVRPKISDAQPALFIAMGVFAVAFIVLLFAKIEEPESQVEAHADKHDKHSAFSFRHFNLGILAIFLYMGLEVGTPTYMIQYLSSDTPDIKTKKEAVLQQYEDGAISSAIAAEDYYALTHDVEAIKAEGNTDKIDLYHKSVEEIKGSLEGDTPDLTVEKNRKTTEGLGISIEVATLIAAVYWLLMLVGRFIGGVIGGKVSSRVMVSTVATGSVLLVLFGMFAPAEWTMNVPGIDWAKLSLIWTEVPIGVFAFILVGLCTSVMWGGIFNLATEGLGKYTAIASGAFMTMVAGCAVMVFLQALVADWTGSYLISYYVPLACALYILFYALIGSKNVNKDIKVD